MAPHMCPGRSLHWGRGLDRIPTVSRYWNRNKLVAFKRNNYIIIPNKTFSTSVEVPCSSEFIRLVWTQSYLGSAVRSDLFEKLVRRKLSHTVNIFILVIAPCTALFSDATLLHPWNFHRGLSHPKSILRRIYFSSHQIIQLQSTKTNYEALFVAFLFPILFQFGAIKFRKLHLRASTFRFFPGKRRTCSPHRLQKHVFCLEREDSEEGSFKGGGGRAY